MRKTLLSILFVAVIIGFSSCKSSPKASDKDQNDEIEIIDEDQAEDEDSDMEIEEE